MGRRVAELIAEIQKLPKADQDKIIKGVQQYQKITGTYTEAEDPKSLADSKFVLEVLAEFLKARGIEHTSVALMIKSSGYTAYKERISGVCEWLAKQHLSKNQRRQLLHYGFGCMYDNLRGMGIPIGSRMMMQSISFLPVVMEKEFPGYAALGLLKHVVAPGGGRGEPT